MVTKGTITGMLLGVGIGDALGRPIEGWSHEEVRSTFGRITRYTVADGWPTERKAGITTDDTQLTLAVAEGLLRSGGKPDMAAQVVAHIDAFNESTQGWGGSTFGAVRRLTQGVPWQLAGARGGRITGLGNGCTMKMAPSSLLLLQRMPGATGFIADLCSMTHQTSIAVSAALAHASGLAYCLQADPASFNALAFVEVIIEASRLGRSYFPGPPTEDITERLAQCRDFAAFTPERCVTQFQNGGNHILHSLPFTYTFFLREPRSVESLIEVVSAGGDADSNGSIVGSLLGALNGRTVFPPHLVEELEAAGRLVDMANRLCDVFGID